MIQTDPRAPNGKNRVQVHYKHRREIDKYFELPLDMQARIPGCVRSRLGTRKNVKARVTYDEKTGEVLNKIVKARVADIDLHMPKCPMDCRISINLEMNWDGTVEELEQVAGQPTQGVTDRRKDRLSYKQGNYQIDLTQVTMPNAQGVRRLPFRTFLRAEFANRWYSRREMTRNTSLRLKSPPPPLSSRAVAQ